MTRSGNNTHNTQSMLDLQRHLHRVHRADRSSLRPARMLYGIICVYLLAKAYECNVRYFILHRNVPLRSDVVQFFAVFAAQKICSLNPFSLSLPLIHSRQTHPRSANPFSHAHLTTSYAFLLPFLHRFLHTRSILHLSTGRKWSQICYNGGIKDFDLIFTVKSYHCVK